MRAVLFALALALSSAPVCAADLTVRVQTADGRPAADAVVILRPAAGSPGGPIRFPWPYVVSQRNIQFDPHVLIVPVGAEVTFPNRDTVRHHVYSFSPAKKFELKLYGREEARTVKFDKPGLVAVGCNIHDQMVAFIYVVDTPLAAKTGANGEAVIRGAPEGAAKLTVWRPDVKAPKSELARPVKLGPGASREVVTVELRAGGH